MPKKKEKKPVSHPPRQENTDVSGRRRALEAALDAIQEQFGRGSIMKMGDMAKLTVDAIPTGSISLDLALGIGGVPRGRIIEIFGPEGSGKTTLAMQIIATAQKKGGLCAFIDAEHAFDPEYAKGLGIKLEDLLISQPDTGEQALEIAETLVRSNATDVIVVDSVAALVPRAEIEGEMGDAQMGLQARLMSQALRKLTGVISKSKAIVIFINQLRMKIGIMFGNPETTPGGLALKFYSSVRIDLRRTEQLKEGETVIGNRVRAKIVKNKVAPPFRTAEFDIIYPTGINREGDLLDTGLKFGVLEKVGNWWVWGKEKIGQGRESARKYLMEHAKIADKLEEEIWKKIKEKKD